MNATAPGKSTWVKVSKSRPCEACGKPDYCTRTADGTLVKCMRAQSSRAVPHKDGPVGWIHLVADLGGTAQPTKAKPERARLTRAEIEQILKRHKAGLSTKRLELLATELGVSIQSLRAYRVGFDDTTGCYSAPMFDAEHRPIGIHLRRPKAIARPDGKNKLAVLGSRNGLFIPDDYSDYFHAHPFGADPDPLMVFTPEGLSDCCAAFDAGSLAIGRPSNNSGGDLLQALIASAPIKLNVAVVADRDETKFLLDGTPQWPGLEGAIALCDRLFHANVCGRLQFVVPPDGAGKDIRAWLSGMPPLDKFNALLTEAKPVSRAWLAAAHKRIEQKRKAERRKPAA